MGVVATAQAVGFVAAIVMALLAREPLPQGSDLGWSAVIGVAGVIGMTSLYRGLAVGRMGVVAPTTGVLGALIPVAAGFVIEGVPSPFTIVGIVAALLAVVLVTRSPGHDDDRPSGIRWALLAATGIGVFNIGIGQLSGAAPFGSLAVFRLIQAGILLVLIVAWRQPWRMERAILPKLVVIGLLDMAGNATFILAVGAGALAIASVLSSLYPVTTVLLALVVLRERFTRSHAVGIVLTALGVALIAYGTSIP